MATIRELKKELDTAKEEKAAAEALLNQARTSLAAQAEQLQALQNDESAVAARLKLRKPTKSRVMWGLDTYLLPLLPVVIGLVVRVLGLLTDAAGSPLMDLVWNTEWPIGAMTLYGRLWTRLNEAYPETIRNDVDLQKVLAGFMGISSALILLLYFLDREGIANLSGKDATNSSHLAHWILGLIQVAFFVVGARVAWLQDTEERQAWAEAFKLDPKEVGLSVPPAAKPASSSASEKESKGG